jgi:hypothetical protein
MSDRLGNPVAWRWAASYFNAEQLAVTSAWQLSSSAPSGGEGFIVEELYPRSVVDELLSELDTLTGADR